jgi:hypothetical protein
MSEIIPICDKREMMYYLVTYGNLSQIKMSRTVLRPDQTCAVRVVL